MNFFAPSLNIFILLRFHRRTPLNDRDNPIFIANGEIPSGICTLEITPWCKVADNGWNPRRKCLCDHMAEILSKRGKEQKFILCQDRHRLVVGNVAMVANGNISVGESNPLLTSGPVRLIVYWSVYVQRNSRPNFRQDCQ